MGAFWGLLGPFGGHWGQFGAEPRSQPIGGPHIALHLVSEGGPLASSLTRPTRSSFGRGRYPLRYQQDNHEIFSISILSTTTILQLHLSKYALSEHIKRGTFFSTCMRVGFLRTQQDMSMYVHIDICHEPCTWNPSGIRPPPGQVEGRGRGGGSQPRAYVNYSASPPVRPGPRRPLPPNLT